MSTYTVEAFGGFNSYAINTAAVNSYARRIHTYVGEFAATASGGVLYSFSVTYYTTGYAVSSGSAGHCVVVVPAIGGGANASGTGSAYISYKPIYEGGYAAASGAALYNKAYGFVPSGYAISSGTADYEPRIMVQKMGNARTILFPDYVTTIDLDENPSREIAFKLSDYYEVLDDI